jgi:trimeric autotransporter adhesin
MKDGSINYFNGSTIYFTSNCEDAHDSNCSMNMTGGTIIANGPNSQPNVALDYNQHLTFLEDFW